MGDSLGSDPDSHHGVAVGVAVGDLVAGRFRIESVLGEGGMGVVYAARHVTLDTTVALKVLRPATANAHVDTIARTRFEREARALASLDDDHVARVFDFGELPNGASFMVMERLLGRDLGSEVQARGPLPVAEAAGLLIQACAGLNAAHTRGIVHRDVKPSNLFLANRPNGTRILKVLDFGIAKVAPGERDLQATGSAVILGSPLFMAPEQVRSTRDVDSRADIWALGVVLHYVLSASPPFDGETFAGLCAAIAADPPKPLVGVPEGMVAVVTKCLRKSPEFRYANAIELAEALSPFAPEATRVLVAQMCASSAPTEPRPAGEGSRRPASADPLAATEAEQTGTRGDATVEPRRPLEDAAAPRRRSRAGLAAAAAGFVVAVAVSAFVWSRGPKGAAESAGAPAPSAPPAATDAERAYQQGMSAFYEGAIPRALERLERATTLDPELARAHLQYVAVAREHIDETVRGHARDARRLRSSLTEDEALLLDAFEPLVAATPDLRKTERKLASAFESHPGNIDFPLHLCRIRVALGDMKAGIEACSAVIAKAPRIGEAHRAKARALTTLRDIPRARASYEACLDVTPTAAACLLELSLLAAREGHCDELQGLAQRSIAADPTDTVASDHIASALWAQGAAREAVQAALRTGEGHIENADVRAVQSLTNAFHLDTAYGNFDGAEVSARTWLSTVAPSSDETEQTLPRDALMGLLSEEGRIAEASSVAAALARERAGWSASTSVSWEPIAWPAQYRSGALTKRALGSAREAWLARELARADAPSVGDLPELAWKRPLLWILAFAGTVLTREDANEALAALPAFGLYDPLLEGPEEDADYGHVYALAERYDEAVPYLRAASSSCLGLAFPIHATRAAYELGEAFEHLGKTNDACAAYATVTRRWNGPGARSISARKAAARTSALKCP